MKNKQWRSVAMAAIVASTLALSACGGSADAAVEQTDVTIGLIPVLDPGLVFIALEKGYFKDRGLNVKLKSGVGGATNATAMAAGDIDVGFGAYVTILQAHNKGILDVAIIAEAARASKGLAGIYSLADSDVVKPADLTGKKLALAQVRTIPDLAAQAVLKDLDVDYDKINRVEMPYPEMGAGLARGDFDAAWLTEPFITLLKQNYKVNQVVDAYSGPTDGLAIAGFYTTKKFAKANPTTIASIQAGLAEAAKFVKSSPDEARDLIQVHTKLSDEVMNQVTLPDFPADIDIDKIAVNANLMVDAGYLDKPVDIKSLIIK
ncbi:ABC transporter substrate-binding protein [Specibacter sp. RAF43]|uniref:ABC transporter substrate-binding protein n=1 Tax=Specibacter sp. RAF43 TaxID=3233057 RepID=UPI003F9886DF